MSEKICKINSASQSFNTVYQNVDFFLTRLSEKTRDLAVVVFLHLVKNIEYIYYFLGEDENFFHYGYWALFFWMRQA